MEDIRAKLFRQGEANEIAELLKNYDRLVEEHIQELRQSDGADQYTSKIERLRKTQITINSYILRLRI